MTDDSTDTWPLVPLPPPVEPPARPTRRRAPWLGALAVGAGAAALGLTVGPGWLLLAGGYLVGGTVWHLVRDEDARRRRALLSSDPAAMTGRDRLAWRARVEWEISALENLRRGPRLPGMPAVTAEVTALREALNRSLEADRADPDGWGLR